MKSVKWLYVITNFIIIAVNLADTVYFRFTMRRTSMTFFSEFTGDVKFFRIFLDSLILYWPIALTGLAMLLVLIKCSGKYTGPLKLSHSANYGGSVVYRNKRFFGKRFYIGQIVALLLSVPVIIVGIRGGVTATMTPINIGRAGDFTTRAIHASAVLNTPFCLIRTIGKDKYTAQDFFKDYKTADAIFDPVHAKYESNDSYQAIQFTDPDRKNLKGMNIVILQLESFAAENMYFLNHSLEKNFTPFLDSLRKQGLFCTSAFANGRKSIAAIPSILMSIPCLIFPLPVTPYATNKTFGMSKILDSLGYYTAFMHGAPNTSMGIRATAHLCGVEHYYGMNEFGDDSKFDGAWGIWDDYFLPFCAKKITSFNEPFCVSIFSLSSHEPFKIPKKYQKVLPDGRVPMQKATAYTDVAIRHFFDVAKKQPWFKNTIFVITPDHGIVQGVYPKYANSLWNTSIPIIYYAPGIIKPGEYHGLTQQIDIMPTLLGLLGYDKPYFAFGRNINDADTKPFVINYGPGGYQLIQGDTLLVRNDKKLTGIFMFRTDTLIHNNLINSPAIDKHLLKKQDTYFKAIIQQYVNRLIDNKLTVSVADTLHAGSDETK
jgi:phosphoglycerol transferase MdoB-like AlkP superfamily enzyme